MNGAHGIIFNSDRSEVLLIKRRDVPIWVLPGGKIEENESPEQAAIREVFEETGFRTGIIRKVATYDFSFKDGTDHLFECQIVDGDKTLSKESKEIEFTCIYNLPEMRTPFLDTMIEDALSNQNTVVHKVFHGFPKGFWIKAFLHPWALFKYGLTRLGIHLYI
jgi:8-oxo-dGTP diphosphatase